MAKPTENRPKFFTISTTLAILFLLCVSCTTPPAESTSSRAKIPPEPPSSKASIFEEYITRMAELGEFNGNVLIAEKGEIIYQRSIGQRSAKPGDLLNLGSQFQLASLSKPFTAMAIMRLKEAGELDYEDPIQKHIPEWPYEGATIRNLLNHTSGMQGHVRLFKRYFKPWLGPFDPERTIEGYDQMIRMFIDHQPEVHFQPGERYDYGGTGYILLAIIVERVSGIPFHQFMRDSVFLPAGMKNTYVYSPLREDPLTNRAYGIMPSLDGRGLTTLDFWYLSPLAGSLGIYSTLQDLYRWDRILYTDKLVSASTLEEAFTPATLNNGDTTIYGFGWAIWKTSSGGKAVGHAGYGFGFGVQLTRELDEDRTLIILTNSSLSLHGRGGLIPNLRRIWDGEEYQLPIPSIAKVFGPTLVTQGIDAARQQYHELKQNRADEYIFGVDALNGLAANLLRHGYTEEALLASQFNFELYPEAIVWHRLGRAYFHLGDVKNAIANYRKALEVDPEFAPSKERLAWLKKMDWED